MDVRGKFIIDSQDIVVFGVNSDGWGFEFRFYTNNANSSYFNEHYF